MEKERISYIVKSVINVIIASAVVFSLTSSYYINNYTVVDTKKNTVETDNFTKLKKVLGIVEEDFLFEDYKMEKLEEGAISGMLKALDDPYTSYFTKEQTESFLIQTEGEYVGVGMYITYGKDIKWPMVLTPIKNSPASEGGILPGDFIYKINDEQIASDTTLEEVSHLLKGPEETTVKVTFIRYDENKNEEEFERIFTRRKIEISPIECEIKDGNIGYIKFVTFDEGVDAKFLKAYNKLVNEDKVKGIIIDLRDNSGGLLDTAINIADRLVPSGIITYTVDKHGKKDVEKSDDRKTDVPLVVLINENSASASEVLSGCLKDHGVAKIVGKNSFGKGLVQEFKSLKDGTYIKMTIAEYFSPNGTKINKVGIAPDYEVDNDEKSKEDAQLNKALEVIKTMK